MVSASPSFHERGSLNLTLEQTDDQVGAAIRDSGIPRKDIFITTKFWPNWGAPENVERCLDACLKDMKLEYIDLYLAHWPLVLRAGPNLPDARATSDASNQERGIAVDGEGNPLVDWQHTVQSIASDNGKIGSFEQTWKAMQSLVTLRKTRAIGVSNFNVQQLKEVMSFGGNVPLSCNQVESHPWFQNAELLQFMKSEHILSTVFCPFAGQQADGKTLVKDPSVRHMAAELDMGVGQLLQSWAVQRGTIPLGKSQHEGQSTPASRTCVDLEAYTCARANQRKPRREENP